jgi:Acetyltransferase (GNAT) domain
VVAYPAAAVAQTLAGDEAMIYEIDPLTDLRWREFLCGNPQASVFHTREWLQALYRTYGHKPAALTTSGPCGELANALVFCRVRSPLTGSRLVSLPFSDHCDPLFASPDDLAQVLSALAEKAHAEHCRYVELRPLSVPSGIQDAWQIGQVYYHHRLDLRPGSEAVFRTFHRDCVQRRIRHAEKQEITITEGRDPNTLLSFYNLVLQTRRRHGFPPQPLAWFKNLIDCLGEAATIRCAYKDAQPIAAILTLRYGRSLYYKYGASAARFHRYGAMPYLFWHAIKDAIRNGFDEFDMGRSDCGNPGLLTFKERWRPTCTLLSYLRSPLGTCWPTPDTVARHALLQKVCRYMPDSCLMTLGKLSYRHID